MSMTDTGYEHDRVVTTFFDTRAAAEKARADLRAAGLNDDAITITEGRDGTPGTTGSVAGEGEGFWESLKSLFAPEEDKHAYAEGLHRGGFLVTAHTDEAEYERVLHILDRDGAVDMNERETQWRSEGWTGRNDAYSAAGGAGAGLASTGLAGAGMRETGTTRPGATTATSATGAGTAGYAETGSASLRGGAAGMDTTGLRGRTAGADPAAVTGRTTEALDTRDSLTSRDALAEGEEVIPIAEERLRVGKRDVNHGRVRLRSYVVEKPVDESINLHSERVDVSRRPVDRALSPGENLFQERTISAEEHDEEAVVSKDARVVEEVRLGKVAQDRREEIHDTVRRTEVEIDDERTGHVAGGVAGTTAGALGRDIAEHMEVIASDGTHVGTVDHLDGDRIKLTRSDSADGQHHFIPRSWVARVEDRVHLNKAAADVRSGWSAA